MTTVSGPPGWTITVEEVSAGYFRISGEGPRGFRVEDISDNPDKAIETVRAQAAELSERARAGLEALATGETGIIPCDKCNAGTPHPWVGPIEMAALDLIAVIRDGPAFLKRCRYCGTLWDENLRSFRIVSLEEARATFTDYPF